MRFFRGLVALALTVSCVGPAPNPPPPPAPMPAPPPQGGLRVVERTFPLANLSIERNLGLVFSEPLSPESVGEGALSVARKDTGEVVSGSVSFAGKALTFTPERRFHSEGRNGKPEAWWSGFKPDTTYVLRLSEKLRGVSGKGLSSGEREISFSTLPGDMGIYWLGPDGSYEKAVPGVRSTLFDPAKPVLLFLHGWENTTSRNDFFRENPFVFNNAYFGAWNLLPFLHAHGYNVASFYWNQWSDEDEVQVAEGKVWRGKSGFPTPDGADGGMRFRRRDGLFLPYSTEKNMAEILLGEYLSALESFRGGHVRLVAHSLGSQLASHFLHLLSLEVEQGKAPRVLMPSRLALLDPFWSRNPRSYLGGKWSGEVCREYLTELVPKYDIAFEFVKTSIVGGHLVGDRNLGLRSLAAYYRIRPGFIPFWGQDHMHWYSYVWYFGAFRDFSFQGRPGMGGAASDEDVRSRMNLRRKDKVTWMLSKGASTPEAGDDVLESVAGVDGF